MDDKRIDEIINSVKSSFEQIENETEVTKEESLVADTSIDEKEVVEEAIEEAESKTKNAL